MGRTNVLHTVTEDLSPVNGEFRYRNYLNLNEIDLGFVPEEEGEIQDVPLAVEPLAVNQHHHLQVGEPYIQHAGHPGLRKKT